MKKQGRSENFWHRLGRNPSMFLLTKILIAKKYVNMNDVISLGKRQPESVLDSLDM